MERSYLIQRLERPWRTSEEHPLFGKDNPFSFGGGLRNGGLSEEAMNLTRELWQYDYMGSAEFEWGAVPEALQKMAKTELEATSFTIDLNDVAKDWRDKSKKAVKGEATIYTLAPPSFRDEIERRIRAYAAESYIPKDPELRLKEATHLASTLRPYSEYDGRTVGWLELDNGYMFFTDEDMFKGACSLFGVES